MLLSNTGLGYIKYSLERPETPVRQCASFSYDHSMWDETITEKFDLVCSRAGWTYHINTILMAGGCLGAYISGMVSDKVC